ncbi:MAG: hypothetical protein LBE79_01600, partial [Tannerella sp.]|nr:hypothetical protein [Tannerella sp.]
VDTFSWLYGFKTQTESKTIYLELQNWTISLPVFLPMTDWKDRARTFTVDKINNKMLILKGDDKTYTFDKF